MINTDTRRLRRRLTDPVQRADFPVFQDMAANGVTDYLAQLVGYGAAAGVRREGLIARWMTRHPDGFRDSDLAVFDSIGRRAGAALLPGLEHSITRHLIDRKSTRLTPVTNAPLECRLLLEKKNPMQTRQKHSRETTVTQP